MKSVKGFKKRFTVSANGKLKHKCAGTGHLMRSKNAKRRRRLGKPKLLNHTMSEKYKVRM